MNLRKRIAGMALALSAAVAPLAAKAAVETDTKPESVEMNKEEKTAKLKEAILLAQSQNKKLGQQARMKLVKFINFPDWMPTTKDGQFDVQKADKMFDAAGLNEKSAQQAFKEYQNSVEKGTDQNVALQKFAEQIAGGDQEKMKGLNQIMDILKEMPAVSSDLKRTGGVLAIGLLIVGVGFMAGGIGLRKDAYTKEGRFLANVVAAAGLLSIAGAGASQYFLKNADLRGIYRVTSDQIYQTHIKQEIQKATQAQIVQMDMNQAKQFIAMTRQKGPSK